MNQEHFADFRTFLFHSKLHTDCKCYVISINVETRENTKTLISFLGNVAGVYSYQLAVTRSDSFSAGQITY